MSEEFHQTHGLDNQVLNLLEIIPTLQEIESRSSDSTCKRLAQESRLRLLAIARLIAPKDMDAQRKIAREYGD